MKQEIGFWIGIVGLAIAVASILLSIFLYLLANARLCLVRQIRDVLGRCRKCDSWDERSEMKLFQFIGAEENRLECYGTKSLVRIRNRTYEYLKVHMKMDGDEYPYVVPFCTWGQFLFRELFGFGTDEFVD